MLETIKTIGAYAGLVTAAFVVWDRWARGRPLAWVTAKKFGANSFKYIRLQNPGPADVFIMGVRADPPIYGIARDHSEKAIAEAVVEIDVNVLLWQGETYDLPIFELPKPVDAPKDARPQPVRFVIYWYKTSSSWLRQVPVTVRSSTRDIESIAAALAAQRSGVP
jgi:hypothetical protein